MITLLPIKLEDRQIEEVRRSHHDAIVELQKLPFAGAVVITGIKLLDGVLVPVAHGLGRRPIFVRESIVRPLDSASPILASGRIVEDRTTGGDLKNVIVLKATGFGANVLVDLVVV